MKSAKLLNSNIKEIGVALFPGLWYNGFRKIGRGNIVIYGRGFISSPGSHCSDYKLQLSSLWSEL